MTNPQIYVYDFGYGTLRIDINRISITEKISKDGTYEGFGFACEFDFKLLEFTRKLKKFLETHP